MTNKRENSINNLYDYNPKIREIYIKNYINPRCVSVKDLLDNDLKDEK